MMKISSKNDSPENSLWDTPILPVNGDFVFILKIQIVIFLFKIAIILAIGFERSSVYDFEALFSVVKADHFQLFLPLNIERVI